MMSFYKIIKLQVTNFRNIYPHILEFGPGINCIFGENGNGKTNLLEAINVLILRKSFRKKVGFPQMLSMDGDKCEIYFSSLLLEESTSGQVHYSGKINPTFSEWNFNGLSKKKKIAPLLFINPFDFYSFHSLKKFRREFFDDLISKLVPPYKKQLLRFGQLIRMRNILLQEESGKSLGQLDALDKELAKTSCELIQARKIFLRELGEHYPQIYNQIFSEYQRLDITLKTKFDQSTVDDIFYYYQQNRERDKKAGVTLYGVHKDDYSLLLNDLSSPEYSSLGQQKSSFLSILFAYIELFRYKFNSYPIILIDDVSGELDQNRWQRLIEYLEERSFQVFITTANENFKEKLEKIKNAKKIYIDQGKMTVKD